MASHLQGAAYVLNVVVSSKHRRQGIGIMLMAAAADMAKQEWASSRMCARVSAQNHVGFFTTSQLLLEQAFLCGSR